MVMTPDNLEKRLGEIENAIIAQFVMGEQRLFVQADKDWLIHTIRELLSPPDNKAWESVVEYAYKVGGDGASNIASITGHYNAMRAELTKERERNINKGFTALRDLGFKVMRCEDEVHVRKIT